MRVAEHFGTYVVPNYRQDCDWVNSTYTCSNPETGLTVTDTHSRWLSFWQSVVSSVKNGCSKVVYEPLNEPLVSGTIKKWEHLIVPWDQCNYSPTTIAFVQRLV